MHAQSLRATSSPDRLNSRPTSISRAPTRLTHVAAPQARTTSAGRAICSSAGCSSFPLPIAEKSQPAKCGWGLRPDECRVTVEDDLYVATLAPTRPLRCLDLTRGFGRRTHNRV